MVALKCKTQGLLLIGETHCLSFLKTSSSFGTKRHAWCIFILFKKTDSVFAQSLTIPDDRLLTPFLADTNLWFVFCYCKKKIERGK